MENAPVKADSERLEDLDVKVLRLEPGDVLVFRTEKEFSADTVERMRLSAEAMLMRAGLPGLSVAILQAGISLEVLRKGAALSTVHALRRGLALCGFTAAFPVAWPEGHRWTGEYDLANVTCADCLTAIKHIPRGDG